MQPTSTANEPINQTHANAPAPGRASRVAPRATESRPLRAIIHSTSISLRSWNAPQISSKPVTIAQLGDDH